MLDRRESSQTEGLPRRSWRDTPAEPLFGDRNESIVLQSSVSQGPVSKTEKPSHRLSLMEKSRGSHSSRLRGAVGDNWASRMPVVDLHSIPVVQMYYCIYSTAYIWMSSQAGMWMCDAWLV